MATEFAPAYPPQREDISFGLTQNVVLTTFLGGGSAARLVIPNATVAAEAGDELDRGGHVLRGLYSDAGHTPRGL